MFYSIEKNVNSADILWANKVKDAYDLAVAIGIPPIENNILVRSLEGYFGVTVEGYFPIFGQNPSSVISKFFKSLFLNRQNDDVIKTEFIILLLDLPDQWDKILLSVGSFFVPKEILEIGTSGEIIFSSDKFDINEVKYASSIDNNISFTVLRYIENKLIIKYKVDESVSLGKYSVYLYGKKSKLIPIDQFDVLVTMSQQD